MPSILELLGVVGNCYPPYKSVGNSKSQVCSDTYRTFRGTGENGLSARQRRIFSVEGDRKGVSKHFYISPVLDNTLVTVVVPLEHFYPFKARLGTFESVNSLQAYILSVIYLYMFVQ